MSLIHIDGFELYPNNLADMPVGASADGKISGILCNSTTPVADAGRFGGRALRADTTNHFYTVSLATGKPVLVLGFAFKLDEAVSPGYVYYQPTVEFAGAGTVHLRFHHVGSEIQVRLGNSSSAALLGTTNGANLQYGTWTYLEFKVAIDNSLGAVEIRANGNLVLQLTDVDTYVGSSGAIIDSVRLGHNYNVYFDDLYILDTEGSVNNDFLGDCRVDVVRPNAAGTHTDFTPSAGSNYENVDDTPSNDGDTTNNTSTGVGDKDSYNLGALTSPPAGAQIYGIKTIGVMRKTDAGSKTAKLLTIAGATEHQSDAISVSDSYVLTSEIVETNPADSAAFEDADINALEVGVEDVA